jgi:hypothetical protein
VVIFLSGNTKSCGECNRYQMIGKKFNRLLVLERTTKADKSGEYYYACRCDCGSVTYATSSSLKRGEIKSCGCYSSEVHSDIAKKLVQLRKRHNVDGAYVPALASKLRSNNTSGCTGVDYNKRNNRWVARISLKGKVYRLGTFKRKEDAIKARKRAEQELFEPIIEEYAKRRKHKE